MNTHEHPATDSGPNARPASTPCAGAGRGRRVAAPSSALLTLAVLATSITASADASARWLLGATAGPLQVSFDDASTDDEPLNAGLLVGREFGTLPGRPALQLELTRSVSPGRVVGTDFDVDTHGLYVAARTPGRLYLTGRVGLMFAAIDGALAEPENGETYGVGLGWQRRSWSIELNWTSIDDDVSSLSAGLVHRFAR